MIIQLAHVCIHTRNLDETSRFYFEGLGLERGYEFIKDGELFGYYVNVGGNTFIEVFKGEPAGEGTLSHFALQVDDIDQIIARLRTHGYEASDKLLGNDHAWQSWTTDPSGVRIELHEYTPKSLQLTGGQCAVTW